MVNETEALEIYRSAIHFDGLNIANWSRDIFEAWNEGGITGVSCTCGIWEGFRGSIANVVQWKKWFEEHSDLIVQAHTVRDIRQAKIDRKTAVLLSWQNTKMTRYSAATIRQKRLSTTFSRTSKTKPPSTLLRPPFEGGLFLT